MIFAFADENDFDSWLDLLSLVKDSFPGLNVEEYKVALSKCIMDKEALVAKTDNIIVGALTFSHSNNELTFLAVHPQYRKNGIAKELVLKYISLFPAGTKLSVITYRDGDPKGTAARKLYQSIGFCCGELLTVFNYPCQELFYTIR